MAADQSLSAQADHGLRGLDARALRRLPMGIVLDRKGVGVQVVDQKGGTTAEPRVHGRLEPLAGNGENYFHAVLPVPDGRNQWLL